MSEGPYTASHDPDAMQRADAIDWYWIERGGKKLTMNQVAERLNEQATQIERMREALNEVLTAGLPSNFCSTECLGTCRQCKALEAARAALEETK